MERWYASCTICCSGCSGSENGCNDWADRHEEEFTNHRVVVDLEENGDD